MSKFIVCCLISALLTGCAPTYPKERFKESIIELCKKEYSLDVKVETIGKTIAIYLPLDNLIDFNFALTKKAGEKINGVILSATRVALSTDAKYDFYCIIAHDVRIPEIQIVIIKSVEDVKRFFLGDISRTEYTKRLLIDMRLSPQAQKERSIKEVLEKMSVDKKTQDQIMNDFFRSEPAALGDIGYWNGRFYIKDVSLPEFIAEQMASRIKVAFREDEELDEAFILKYVKGAYITRDGKNFFRLEVLAESRLAEGIMDKTASDKIFRTALRVAVETLRGYRFEDFDHLEMMDQMRSNIVDVSREDLEKFRQKKLKFEEIIK